MKLVKQAHTLIATLNIIWFSWTSLAAQTHVDLEALQAELSHCRLSPPKAWFIQGFAAAQTELPQRLEADDLSFFRPSLPDPLRRAIPNQIGQLNGELDLSRDQVLDELVRQIQRSQCPIEVLGFASREGAVRQNIGFASDRRDNLIAELRQLGIPAHAIYSGSAEILEIFPQLPKNRRVVIRTRPDLAWRCEVIVNAEEIFPNHGRLLPVLEGSIVPDEDVESFRDLWEVLGSLLQNYPCQHLLAIQGVDAEARSVLEEFVRSEIPELANRVLSGQSVGPINFISLGVTHPDS